MLSSELLFFPQWFSTEFNIKQTFQFLFFFRTGFHCFTILYLSLWSCLDHRFFQTRLPWPALYVHFRSASLSRWDEKYIPPCLAFRLDQESNLGSSCGPSLHSTVFSKYLTPQLGRNDFVLLIINGETFDKNGEIQLCLQYPSQVYSLPYQNTKLPAAKTVSFTTITSIVLAPTINMLFHFLLILCHN